MSNDQTTYKIVLLGEGRVGKTSIVLRYVNNSYEDETKSTVQATYLQKDVKLPEKTITLSIWDTAGQERYHALGPIYYRGADGALLVYDLTDQDSFIRAQNWVKELRKVVGEDIVISIAGNKSDLKKRVVDENQVIDYCKSVDANHFLTSAKVNKGINEAFLDITKRIYEKKSKKESFVQPKFSQPKIRIVEEEKKPEPSNCNC